MKMARWKQLLSCALAIAVSVVGLCTNVYGVEAINEIYGENPVTGEYECLSFEIKNEQGEWERVNVRNEHGELEWVYAGNEQGELEWMRVQDVPSEAALTEKVRAQKAALESRFGIKLTGIDETNDPWPYISDLTELENAMQTIPAPLYEAVRAKLSAKGKILTLHLDYEGEILTANEAGRYSPRTNTIILGEISRFVFAHEYGHMLQLTLLDAQYGATTLKNQWTALNHGVAYGNGNDTKTFISDYSTKSYQEDFADNVGYLFGDPRTIQYIAMQQPDSPVIEKLVFLCQLLSETFSVDPSVFPELYPSMPSEWAVSGIAKYLEIFPYGELASNAPFDKGYQSGTTRQDFAHAAYSLTERHWPESYFSEEHGRWIHGWEICYPDYPDYPYGIIFEYNPFTDLPKPTGYSSDYADSIVRLYLMGVINGRSETIFDPEGLITRQEAAVMLYRLCVELGYEFPAEPSVTFNDENQFADWAKESINAVCSAGIMNGVGDGNFDPMALYSYEQSALTMVRVYELLTENNS